MWGILGAIVVVLGWGMFAYNRMVRLRMEARAAWSQIDVQLRRRHALIPTLVESVKGYMAHERDTLEAVAAARSQAQAADEDVALRAAAEARLGGAVSRMMGLAEAYPALKASANVQMLQEELASTENRIAFARQHFNDCVLAYNTTVGSVPDLLLAGPLGFTPQAMFETDAASRAPVAIRL